MINVFTNFYFYFISFGVFLIILEKLFPWRSVRFFRKQLGQDFFWFIFNGYFFGLLLGYVDPYIFSPLNSVFGFIIGVTPGSFNPLNSLPFILQIILGLVVVDFIEYWLHRLLHLNGILWRIHQLHHSIKDMDWIGNMRFHPFEIVYYKYLKYFPLLFLGFLPEVYLWTGVVSIGIGYLNHSNLKWSYGNLRFVVNSPCLHIYHHDRVNHFKYGQNFAVIFSLWDFIFKTAYMPPGQPEELGFKGDENFPSQIHKQFLSPFFLSKEQKS